MIIDIEFERKFSEKLSKDYYLLLDNSPKLKEFCFKF